MDNNTDELVGLFVRVPRSTKESLDAISKRRGEKKQVTLRKAITQYVSADRRR